MLSVDALSAALATVTLILFATLVGDILLHAPESESLLIQFIYGMKILAAGICVYALLKIVRR